MSWLPVRRPSSYSHSSPEESLSPLLNQTEEFDRCAVVIPFGDWWQNVSAWGERGKFPVLSRGRTLVWVVRAALRLSPTHFATSCRSTENPISLSSRLTSRTRAASKVFPGLERWSWWCYSQSPLLVYDHAREFWSECGVQQGDPLGPLYFCCGYKP